MSRPLCALLLIGLVGLTSCTARRDRERVAQLEAELQELRQSLQAQQAASVAASADSIAAAPSPAVAGHDPDSPPPHDPSSQEPGLVHAQPAHSDHDRTAHSDHDRAAHSEHKRTASSGDAGSGLGEAPAQAHHDAGHAKGRDAQPHRDGHAAPSAQAVRPTGTVIGQIKAKANKGNNVEVAVLAPGEEAPRSYHVMYDPHVKGPVPQVLAAVRAANIGDLAEIGWVQTGHGPAIATFEVQE